MEKGKVFLPEISWINHFKTDLPGLSHMTYHSKSMNREIGFSIYLPPMYTDIAVSVGGNTKKFPVIYWLHGKGGDEATAFKIKIPQLFHRAIIEEKIKPSIMVFPNCGNYSMFCDSFDGKILGETILIKELIPLIDSTYKTTGTREGRSLEGFSMGGFGAVKLAFKFYDLFSSAVTLAGSFHDLESISASRKEIFGAMFGGNDDYFQQNSPYELLKKNADAIKKNIRLKFINGSEDFTLSNNFKLNRALDQAGINYNFKILEGLRHQPAPYYELEGLNCFKFHFGDIIKT
jgi:S-formylglutathione hydrolase FrmB